MTIVTVTETAYDIDWIELAAGVEKLVVDKLKDDLKQWEGDIGMRQMFVQDAADALAVCELLAEGKWHKAENRIRNMDTAARDYVYDFIEIVAGADFFDCVR